MSTGIPLTGPSPLSSQIQTTYPVVAQSVAAASIGASYPSVPQVSLGTSQDRSVAMMNLTNTTNEALWFSYDGVNDHGYIISGQLRTFNFMANRRIKPIGGIFFRSSGVLPSGGDVIWEAYL